METLYTITTNGSGWIFIENPAGERIRQVQIDSQGALQIASKVANVLRELMAEDLQISGMAK